MSQHTQGQSDQQQYWLENGWQVSQVEEELQRLGHTAEEMETIVQSFKKAKWAKRQSTAFTWLGTGAMLGFVSCVWSIINPIPVLFHTVLYGATSLAVAIIMWGLYLLLE